MLLLLLFADLLNSHEAFISLTWLRTQTSVASLSFKLYKTGDGVGRLGDPM